MHTPAEEGVLLMMPDLRVQIIGEVNGVRVPKIWQSLNSIVAVLPKRELQEAFDAMHEWRRSSWLFRALWDCGTSDTSD